MDTKSPANNYHHQRAPRTPESYFNVPESIALLNIVKSERIQNAFQSNRKNHASVWEMVAEVLNRFSSRKRSAKQCCNRYENLKKIYTQLKKNPERHVRRNWPYMFLFKEIEEQRGECWGANSKRLALIAKDHKELSYYHRRRQAAELSVLLNKDSVNAAAVAAQHSLLQSLAQAADTNGCTPHGKLDRFIPNQFVETQLNEGIIYGEGGPLHPLHPQTATMLRKEHDLTNNNNNNNGHELMDNPLNGVNLENETMKDMLPSEVYEKDCNGALNLQTNDNNIPMKSEPLSEGEFNPDDIQLMQTNYHNAQNFYANNIDTNILHPDVIVDTDNLSDYSSGEMSLKRKMSMSTDGDSTNYELIEYLKRREKRDEELLKRMDAREERLLNLLERTVIAIEALSNKNCNNAT